MFYDPYATRKQCLFNILAASARNVDTQRTLQLSISIILMVNNQVARIGALQDSMSMNVSCYALTVIEKKKILG